MLTRRAALRGGTAVACAAAAGMVAAPVLAVQGSPDARVFALIQERGCQLEIEDAARIRCGKAVRSLMPPELRGVDLFDIFDSRWKEADKVFLEIHERPEIKTLFAETRRQDEICRSLKNRIAETPASPLSGWWNTV